MKPKYLFDNLDTLTPTLKGAFSFFIFLDYDGTLVPIAPSPKEALPKRKVFNTLHKLTSCPHIKASIVSGRKVEDLKKILPLKNVFYVGVHGLEVTPQEDHTVKIYDTKGLKKIIQRLKKKTDAMIEGNKGFLVEDKEYALALHFRLVADKLASKVVSKFIDSAWRYVKSGILDICIGKKVVEIRPGGVSKGAAVELLINKFGKESFPIYIGDDTTDEDAFRFLSESGLTILVTEKLRKTSARYYLKNADEVLRFLNFLSTLKTCGRR